MAGILLVAAAIVAARVPAAGRGARAIGVGTVLLGVGGIWLAAGRGAFNLQMYRLTDPAVAPDAALDVAAADVGPGFVPLLLALPALLLGPVLLAVGAGRAGSAGRRRGSPWPAGCWASGTFMASEFTVKAGEVVGIAVATVGLTLLGTALAGPRSATPAVLPAGAPVEGDSGRSGKLPGAIGVGLRRDDEQRPAGVFDRTHRRTTVGLLMLITFIAFEAMAVGTAMPTAVAELDGLAWYGWPFSAFLVASVVGMVVGGDVGDRRGPRVALPWGVAIFAAGLLAGRAGRRTWRCSWPAARCRDSVPGCMVVLLYVIAGQAYARRCALGCSARSPPPGCCRR